MLPDAAVELQGLTKLYRARGRQAEKLALDGVSLTIPRGSFFGLLGPNGAGKSTLINILAGLVNKTAGTARIWGFDSVTDERRARSAIGVVPQELNFDPFFTPRELLEVQAGLYGVPPSERRTDQILAALGLSDKAHAYSRSLSGGMRRRLLVAKAMVHRPPVLVLDEPTAGVDVELRRQLWDLVRQLNDQGVTVVLTTHYLEEAEELCDRIAIINHGRVIADKPTRDLVDMAREKVIVLTLDRPIDAAPQHERFRRSTLTAERQIEISYNKDLASAGEVMATVQALGWGIVDVTTREADLEDVFVALTSAEHAVTT